MATTSDLIDSRAAWLRLVAALALSTLGGVGMWSVVVALPAIQAEFGVTRAAASFPYTLTMLGFGVGGIMMGRLSDRYGVRLPMVGATCALAIGYVAASLSSSVLMYAIVQGLLIGMLGSSATFGPLLADISHWFVRRRGLAVSIVASGNYLAGAVWPPIVQYLIETVGWRSAHLYIGAICLADDAAIDLCNAACAAACGGDQQRASCFARAAVARHFAVCAADVADDRGVACCVAMSMPQVHIVAYCADLGYGPAIGAQMLSIMLASGIVSRLASGWIADHIGGLRTLLLGSVLQGVALLLYIPFDGVTSLFVVSALFGLFQGGIVPSYAIIVREYFAPNQAGARVGLVVMATVFGMALGGWMSGAVFDLTGSYRAAFINGLLWNLLNVSIATWLLRRPGARFVPA